MLKTASLLNTGPYGKHEMFLCRCVCVRVGKKGRRCDIARLLSHSLHTQTELSVLGCSVCLCSRHISHQDMDSNKHSHAGKKSMCVCYVCICLLGVCLSRLRPMCDFTLCDRPQQPHCLLGILHLAFKTNYTILTTFRPIFSILHTPCLHTPITADNTCSGKVIAFFLDYILAHV